MVCYVCRMREWEVVRGEVKALCELVSRVHKRVQEASQKESALFYRLSSEPAPLPEDAQIIQVKIHTKTITTVYDFIHFVIHKSCFLRLEFATL